MDKNIKIKKIYEKYLNSLYEGIVINHFEVVKTYSLNENSNEWVDYSNIIFITIKNNTGKLISSENLERRLTPLFGYEIIINFS